VGHDARGWEGHVDARWRLRHRAVFIGGLGLCDCFHLMLVLVMWVVEVCFSFSNVGSLYPWWSQLIWFRWWMCYFHWIGFAKGTHVFGVFWGVVWVLVVMWEVLLGFSDVVCVFESSFCWVLWFVGVSCIICLVFLLLMFFVLVLVRAILDPRRCMFYRVVPGPNC